MKYIKRSIPIDAQEMDKDFEVKTLEGVMKGKKGDYLITGIKGEQYPCDKEIFEKSYIKVETFVDRMNYEYEELNARIDRLKSFINDNTTFATFPKEQRKMLKIKKRDMEKYLETLEKMKKMVS